MTEHDPFFRTHFSRIDQDVAASFTPEQRRAIKLMFASRASRRHSLDIRRSVSIFGKRFYIVLLGGVERRDKERLRREGMVSGMLDAIASLIGIVALLIPVGILLYFIKSGLGIDIISEGGGHGLLEQVGEQIDTGLR